MRTLLTWSAGLCAVLVLSACSPRGNDVFRAEGLPVPVRVTVDNRDFSDATIYLYWNGFKTRAGMVSGKDQETFVVDRRSDRLQIEADFVGQGTLLSDVIDVFDGDHIHWLIQPTW